MERMDQNIQRCLEEIFSEAQSILADKSKEAAVNHVKTLISAWKEQPVYCAIIGNPGVGKSTFINEIRNLKDDDPLAAETGVVETTTQQQHYPHPQNPNLIFSDLPGCGTPNNPADREFIKKMEFQKYDAFLILSSSRFFENDKWLTSTLNEMEKPYFFVRTKIDQDISNNFLRKRIEEEQTKEIIRKDLEKNLSASTEDEKKNIYLINNFDPKDHDFPRLVHDIIAKLPEVKADALTFSIRNLSQEIIDLKMKALYKRSYIIATVSALCAIPPIPGLSFSVDISLIVSEFIHYRDQLDIRYLSNDRKSIKENVSEYVDNLKEEVSKELVLSNLLKESVALAGSRVTEDVARLVVPIIGQAVSVGISFASTLKVLQHRVEKLGNEAKKCITMTSSNEDLSILINKI